MQMDTSEGSSLGYATNELPRPSRPWPLGWYLVTAAGLAIPWCVAWMTNAFFIPKLHMVAADLGAALPHIAKGVFQFENWWTRSGGWLTMITIAITLYAIGVVADRRASSNQRIRRYALTTVILSLLAALLYLLWVCFCIMVMLPSIDLALRT